MATKKSEKESKNMVEYKPFLASESIRLNVALVQKFLTTPTKSGKQATEADCVRFIMLCQARQLNPWEGDAYLVGYDTQTGPQFNLITAHQALLKRAVYQDDFLGMASGIIVQSPDGDIEEREGDFLPPGYKLLGGWARLKQKGKEIDVVRRINLEPFDKGFGLWKSNPQGQIVKCAEADALRSAYPSQNSGLITREEIGVISQSDATEFIDLDEKLNEAEKSVKKAVADESIYDHADAADNDGGFEEYYLNWKDAERPEITKRFFTLREKTPLSVKGYATKHNIVKDDGSQPVSFSELLDADEKAGLRMLWEAEQKTKEEK